MADLTMIQPRHLVAAAAIVSLLAACGGPRSDTREARPSVAPLGAPGEAVLMRASANDPDTLVFVVAGSEGEREVARIGVGEGSGGSVLHAVVSEGGMLALELQGQGERQPKIVYDLRHPEASVYESAGNAQVWLGPQRLVAIGETDADGNVHEVTFLDTDAASPSQSTITVPDGVNPIALTSDGSGLVALRWGRSNVLGRISSDASFAPGDVEVAYVTGLERPLGPHGEQLSFAMAEAGPDSPESGGTIIAATGPDGDQTWYQTTGGQGMGEPTATAAWDPGGQGLWLVLLSTPEEARLVLLREPGQPTVVATLPGQPIDAEQGPLPIAGIHPDGGTVALSNTWLMQLDDAPSGEGSPYGARTLLVDVATGTVTEYEGTFVGWAG